MHQVKQLNTLSKASRVFLWLGLAITLLGAIECFKPGSQSPGVHSVEASVGVTWVMVGVTWITIATVQLNLVTLVRHLRQRLEAVEQAMNGTRRQEGADRDG